MRAPLAGRPSPELAGNVPKTGKRCFFYLAGDCVLWWFFTLVPAVDDFLVRVFAVSFVFFVLPLLVALYPLLCLPCVLPRYRRRRAAELAGPSSLESHYLCSRNREMKVSLRTLVI